jgi:hypothetical protein
MSLCPGGVLQHGFFEGLRKRKDLDVLSDSANSTSTPKARSERNYTNLHANLQKQLARLDDMGVLIIEESVKRVDLAFKEQLGDIFMRVESNECRYKVLPRPYFLTVCLPWVISIPAVFALFWLSWSLGRLGCLGLFGLSWLSWLSKYLFLAESARSMETDSFNSARDQTNACQCTKRIAHHHPSDLLALCICSLRLQRWRPRMQIGRKRCFWSKMTSVSIYRKVSAPRRRRSTCSSRVQAYRLRMSASRTLS